MSLDVLWPTDEPDPRRDWGGWRYESGTAVLALYDEAGRFLYEVDLERCDTSAALLDWIIQVSGKIFATDRVVAGLIRALDDLLNPQATLCSFGYERGPINIPKILAATGHGNGP